MQYQYEEEVAEMEDEWNTGYLSPLDLAWQRELAILYGEDYYHEWLFHSTDYEHALVFVDQYEFMYWEELMGHDADDYVLWMECIAHECRQLWKSLHGMRVPEWDAKASFDGEADELPF